MASDFILFRPILGLFSVNNNSLLLIYNFSLEIRIKISVFDISFSIGGQLSLVDSLAVQFYTIWDGNRYKYILTIDIKIYRTAIGLMLGAPQEEVSAFNRFSPFQLNGAPTREVGDLTSRKKRSRDHSRRAAMRHGRLTTFIRE